MKKMTVLLRAMYGFNAVPIEIPMTVFTEIEKTIVEFIWKHKRPEIAKAVLSKKQYWRYYSSRFQIILESHSNKPTRYWHKNRHKQKLKNLNTKRTNNLGQMNETLSKEVQMANK
jgi:hypothetical protein